MIGGSGVYIERIHTDSTSLEELHFEWFDDSLSHITIGYKGYFIDGTVFDQTIKDSTVTFILEGLIQGWQIGIPKMTVGDTARLFIPSYHGYGNYTKSIIPKNSVLLYDIYLEAFENKYIYTSN